MRPLMIKIPLILIIVAGAMAAGYAVKERSSNKDLRMVNANLRQILNETRKPCVVLEPYGDSITSSDSVATAKANSPAIIGDGNTVTVTEP